MKMGLTEFCTETHMNGFSELYHSNTLFGKALWGIFIIAAISAAAYQVGNVSLDFASGKTGTDVERVSAEDVIYPDFTNCHTHFLTWFDFDAAQKAGFTKPEILMALAFFDRIYSSRYFTREELVPTFLKKLKSLNLTFEQFFYKFVLEENPFAPHVIRYHETFDLRMMCQTISNKVLRLPPKNNSYIIWEDKKYFATNVKHMYKFIEDRFVFIFPKDNVPMKSKSFLSPEEIDAYKPLTVDTRTMKMLVYILYPSNKVNHHSRNIKPGTGCKSIVRANAYRWKNKPERPCLPGIDYYKSKAQCERECKKLEYQKINMPDIYALWMPGYHQTFEINFLGKNQSEIFFPRSPNGSLIQHEISELCSQKCNKDIGCDVWNYREAFPVCSNTENPAWGSFDVKYPGSVDNQVILVKETDLETWASFVGNMGGLLGVWIGASILTIIQTIYLCFLYSQSKNSAGEQPPEDANNIGIMNNDL